MNTVEEAIEAIAKGEVIIVVDDEDRENEGDFVAAAEMVTPEIINFMATHGRGLICAPLIENRCDELGLELMVNHNSAAFETPFTVSIDLIGHGCSTGISASDRAKTIRALVDPKTKKEELGKPGHIFPLRAKKGGVLRRPGHTEASIDLARLAGFYPAGVLVEVMNEDGTMARLPELKEIAKKFNLKIISIEDLIAYRMKNESLIKREVISEMETEFGRFSLIGFKQTTTDEEHLALIMGNWETDEAIPIRVHSSNTLADVFGNLVSTKESLVRGALKIIAQEGKGILLYMNQQNKNEGLIAKLKVYNEKLLAGDAQGASKAFLSKMDDKDYGIGAQILNNLGVRKMRLITNNTQTRTGIVGYGLEIVENISLKHEE